MQMWIKIIFILFSLSIFISDFTSAQQNPAKKDTNLIYKNIEINWAKRKSTKFMYRLIFKPVTSGKPKKKAQKKVYKKLIQKPYSNFEGKIIRHINIETLDPFGYSITDPIVLRQNFINNTGNKLHKMTRHITIRNLLLIRQNQVFDSLLVKESERLVRTMVYVHDVSFYVLAASKNSDSVDIFIRVLDNWSLIPEGAVSTSDMNVKITDNNFMGLGHKFQNVYARNFTDRIDAFRTNYYIPNLRNTYISTLLHYNADGNQNFNRGITVDRPFYSPFARWAAGASFVSLFRNDSLKNILSVYVPFNLKINTQDFWVGYAIPIFKGNTEKKRTTNFITAVRFLQIRYPEKPTPLLDSLGIYTNENFYMVSIGISTRKYVQDKYIFNYGVVEDVPVGDVFMLTGGYQLRNNTSRLYAGMRISFGNYYPWGYLSSNLEYGTFIHSSNVEQGVITAGINYFTGLIEIGKWKFREFVKPQITIGLKRFSYDSITINDGNGIDGFNSSTLSGTNRLLLSLQTQSYSPWESKGFHFGPYLTFSLGMLGNAETGFKNSKVYSQIGIGVLIKNDNLVINTFQFSISYFPSIPGIGQDVFKFNSFKTTDFGFRDFEIGKPAAVVFQ